MAAERESMLIMKNVSKTFNPGTVNEKCALNGVNLAPEISQRSSAATAQENLPCSMQSPELFSRTAV